MGAATHRGTALSRVAATRARTAPTARISIEKVVTTMPTVWATPSSGGLVDPRAHDVEQLTRHHAGHPDDGHAPTRPSGRDLSRRRPPTQRRDEEHTQGRPDEEMAQGVPHRVGESVTARRAAGATASGNFPDARGDLSYRAATSRPAGVLAVPVSTDSASIMARSRRREWSSAARSMMAAAAVSQSMRWPSSCKASTARASR